MIPFGIEYAAEELLARQIEEEQATKEPPTEEEIEAMTPSEQAFFLGESDEVYVNNLYKNLQVDPSEVNRAIDEANELSLEYDRGEGIDRVIVPIRRGFLFGIGREDLYKLTQEV